MRLKVTAKTLALLVPVIGLAFLMRSPETKAATGGDPRYLVQALTVTGPASITAGGTASYTVNLTIVRQAHALVQGVDGMVFLMDGNTVLASPVFTVLGNQNTTTMTVPLTCTSGNVAGALASSGRSSISLTARVNGYDSAAVTVACAGAKTGC